MTTLGSVGLFGILFNPGRFTLFKSYIVEATGLSRDALHMHFGIGLTLILFVILGRRFICKALATEILVEIPSHREGVPFGDSEHVADQLT